MPEGIMCYANLFRVAYQFSCVYLLQYFRTIVSIEILHISKIFLWTLFEPEVFLVRKCIWWHKCTQNWIYLFEENLFIYCCNCRQERANQEMVHAVPRNMCTLNMFLKSLPKKLRRQNVSYLKFDLAVFEAWSSWTNSVHLIFDFAYPAFLVGSPQTGSCCMWFWIPYTMSSISLSALHAQLKNLQKTDRDLHRPWFLHLCQTSCWKLS